MIMIISQNMIILQIQNKCNIDIIKPALLFRIPCGLSFLWLISLMVSTLIKPLIRKK